MCMTTITVKDNLARELNKVKYNLGLKTVSEVIERLFKIAKKIETSTGSLSIKNKI